MASKKDREYIELIQELQKCKGIGALITAIQNNRSSFDENFFAILDNQIKDAAEQGNQKLAGSLSYLNRVMDNLQIRQNISKTEEEELPIRDEEVEEEEEEAEEAEEAQEEDESLLEIDDAIEKGEMVDALMKIVDCVMEDKLSLAKARKKVIAQEIIDLAETDTISQINSLCNRLKIQVPPKSHILATLLYDLANKLGEEKLIAECGLTLGTTKNIMGLYEEAIKQSEETLALLEKLDDKQSKGIALGNIGNAYYRLGEIGEAINYYNKGLDYCKQIGDRKQIGASVGNLGNAYYRLGDMETAISYYNEALAISREIGDRSGEGNRMGNLGNAYIEFGELEEAIDCYLSALDISKEVKDIRQAGTALGNLGNAYYKMGDMEEAIEYYNQALEISREIKDKRGEGNRLGNLANAYSESGDLEEAIDYYLDSLNISKEIKDRRQAGSTLGNLGNTYYKLGEIDEAIEYYKQAIEMSREIKDVSKEKIWNYNLGLLYEDNMKDLNKAYSHYKSSIKIFEEMKDKIKKKSQRKSFNELNIDMYAKMIILCLKIGKIEEGKEYFSKEKSKSLEEILNNKYNELKEKENLTDELASLRDKLEKILK